MRCEHCPALAAAVAIDLPENAGGLLFGDEVLGVVLCDACLARSEADGPWDSVEALEPLEAAA